MMETLQTSFAVGVQGGMQLSLVLLALTLVFELYSIPTAKAVLKQPDGVSLYRSAVWKNIFNHFFLGIPVYATAVMLFAHADDDDEGGQLQYHPYDWRRTKISTVLGIMLVQSLSYYTAHRAMHSSPSLYRFHRFHHRFSVNVPPVAAFAVSIVEYMIAYIIPFALAAFLTRPNEMSLRVSIHITAFCNLLIHTPKLEELSKQLPPCFVSTFGHLEHHKRLNTYFAAPTLNVDWFVEKLELKPRKKQV